MDNRVIAYKLSTVICFDDKVIFEKNLRRVFFFRQDLLKWNGWGYKDSGFSVDLRKESISFLGDRYLIGSKNLPHFYEWIRNKFDIRMDSAASLEAKPVPSQEKIPPGRNHPGKMLSKF